MKGKGVIILLLSFLFSICLFAEDKKGEEGVGNQQKEEKGNSNIKKMALLEEIGALKGELREFLNEAESIRKKILSKMYSNQARKTIVEKVKDTIQPAEELLEKCKEKEQNVCGTPQVIREAYAKILEEERIKKYEEEKAKIEEQKRKEEEEQRQRQATQTSQQTPPISTPPTPPSSQ